MSSSDSDFRQPTQHRKLSSWRRHRGVWHRSRRRPDNGMLPPICMAGGAPGPGAYIPQQLPDPASYYGWAFPFQQQMYTNGIYEKPISSSSAYKCSSLRYPGRSPNSKRINLARRHAAALTIQQWWKRTCPKLQRRRLLIEEICELIAEQLLDDFIRGDFLPELFLDVIADDTGKFAPYADQIVICKEIIDDISNDVANGLLRSAIRSVICDMVDSYLNRCSIERHRNLLQSLVDEIINEECLEILPGVIREVAAKMVDSYLEYVEQLAYTEAIMKPFVDEVFEEICFESFIENWGSAIIQELARDIFQELCEELFAIAKESARRARVQDEFAVVREHSSIILNQSILQILLHKLATNDENATIQSHFIQHFVDKAFLNRLVSIHYTLNNRSCQVKENVVLNYIHSSIVSETSANVLLGLLQEQLQIELDLD